MNRAAAAGLHRRGLVLCYGIQLGRRDEDKLCIHLIIASNFRGHTNIIVF